MEAFDPADGIAALLDREAIRDCLARLARGEDRRDAALITECYWPDAVTDFGVFSGDFATYLAWVTPGADAIANTQHLLGQSVIDLADASARVETQVLSYHRIDPAGPHRDTVIGGRYLDRLEKRDGAWRIAARTMLYDWHQDLGTAIDWSQGLMGLPLAADHYTGRAHGDPSVAFFAGGPA
ncbi:MAG: nuclear transport factor 2 family protein [Sphingomonas sp.]